MTENEMLEINLEVKMGIHKKGDPYPVLNFGKFQYKGDLESAPDPAVLIVSQDWVHLGIEKLHEKNPHKDQVAYFYLAEADTVISL
jgi:hypothetical protein